MVINIIKRIKIINIVIIAGIILFEIARVLWVGK